MEWFRTTDGRWVNLTNVVYVVECDRFLEVWISSTESIRMFAEDANRLLDVFDSCNAEDQYDDEDDYQDDDEDQEGWRHGLSPDENEWDDLEDDDMEDEE